MKKDQKTILWNSTLVLPKVNTDHNSTALPYSMGPRRNKLRDFVGRISNPSVFPRTDLKSVLQYWAKLFLRKPYSDTFVGQPSRLTQSVASPSPSLE